jgi:hypothetical protein
MFSGVFWGGEKNPHKRALFGNVRDDFTLPNNEGQMQI